MKREEIIDIIKNSNGNKFSVTTDSGTEICRLFVSSSDNICKYAKGSSRRGYLVSFDDWKSLKEYSPTKELDIKSYWSKRWMYVRKQLELWDIWEDMQAEITEALALGYDEIHKKEYSFYKGLPKIKSMCFHKKKRFGGGSFVNKGNINAKANILKAMKEKSELLTSGFNGYDVNFQYSPDKKRAWYSEEFVGCGNGHYYFAINPTQALFREDD